MAANKKPTTRRSAGKQLTPSNFFRSKYAVVIVIGIALLGLGLSYLILLRAGTISDVPEVTPESFGGGALGNGVYNDCADIQLALDSAAKNLQAVRLKPNKTYHCTSNLKLGSNTRFYGNTNAVIKFTWFYQDDLFGGRRAYIATRVNPNGSPQQNIILKNLIVEGAGDGKPSGSNLDQTGRLTPGIQINNVSKFTLEGNEVRNIPGISIMYLGSDQGIISKNYVHNSGRDGISAFKGQGGIKLKDIQVTDNRIEYVGDDGIAINGSTVEAPIQDGVQPSNIVITNNRIIGWDNNPNGKLLGRGIALIAATNVRVVGNYIKNPHSAGIYVRGADKGSNQPYPSTNVSIVTNTIIGAGQSFDYTTNRFNQPADGIVVSGKNILVENNVILNSAAQPFSATDCVDCDIDSYNSRLYKRQQRQTD